jgi:hypothetical protein
MGTQTRKFEEILRIEEQEVEVDHEQLINYIRSFDR